MSHTSKRIEVEDYVALIKNTKPGMEIIEDYLEVGAKVMLHAGPSVGKTNMAFEMAATVLAKRPWMGRFAIRADDVYVFFISQDSPRYEIVRQSWKVLRKYFDPQNAADVMTLRSRLHVIDQQGIKFKKGSTVDSDALVDAIKATIERSRNMARTAPVLREIGATGTDWKEMYEEHLAGVESERMAEEQAASVLDEEQEAEPADEQSNPIVQPVSPTRTVVMLIWDVMRRFHDGKESQSDELVPFFDAIDAVGRTLDATSIVLHHDNRSGEYKGDSSVLGSFDVGFQLVGAKGDDKTADVRTIKFLISKPRGLHARPFEYRQVVADGKTNEASIRFEYVREDGVESGQGRTSRPKKERKPSPTESLMDAVRRLWSPEMSARALHAALKKERIKVSRGRVGKMIEDMKGWTAVSNKTTRQSA